MWREQVVGSTMREGLDLPPLLWSLVLVSVLSPCCLVLLLVRDGLVQSVQGCS